MDWADVDVAFAGTDELSRAYRAGTLSPPEVAAACLNRIAALDPTLRAFVTVTPERAMAQARRAERELRAGRDRGPLHGIPYAVKDQVMTRGIRTTAGSARLAGWVPTADATVVQRMDAAGAVLLGKLNMMEFALGRPRIYAFGTPRNPWNPAHETGGSSSGSGSAPAAGLATIAVGEDTGGSIRHPAAHCGVAGLRPTWGLVSRFGVFPAVWHLDTLGPVARRVADLAIALRVMAGRDRRDGTTGTRAVPDYARALPGNVRGIRVGLVRDLLPGPALSAEGLASVGEAARVLQRAGAVLVEVAIPLVLHAGAIYTAFAEPEAARVHLPMLRESADAYDALVRIRLARGLLVPAVAAQWAAAQGRAALVVQITDALAKCDVLLAPTTPGAAPRLQDVQPPMTLTEDDVRREFAAQSYRMPFSLHGGPALALCCGFTSDGLPLSMQLVAGPHRDDLVLRVGDAFQRLTDWHERRPALAVTTPMGGDGGDHGSLS